MRSNSFRTAGLDFSNLLNFSAISAAVRSEEIVPCCAGDDVEVDLEGGPRDGEVGFIHSCAQHARR